MCNLYTQTKAADAVRSLFAQARMPLGFPEGIPNLQPRDIAITDPGAIVRAARGDVRFELVVRRWSWPGPNGKPVYNYRSDGREFSSGRCLIMADGFYEYTVPADPKKKRKDRWLFATADGEPFAIAGLVRDVGGTIGEAFTMLTTEPGPDVAPHHHRQVAIVRASSWSRWLDHDVSARELLGPAMAGRLSVTPA